MLCSLVYHELSQVTDGKFHAHFFAVGQGDAVLLVSPSGKQILIDGGPDLIALEHLGDYMPFLDRTIELMILTHPDADHVTALPEVLKRYDIDHILFSGAQHESGRYDAFLALLEAKNIPLIPTDPSIDIDMGDGLILDIVWPTPDAFGSEPKNSNDLSVVVRALYRDVALLLPGDIEAETEAAVLATGADVKANILKVPHHGSKTSSTLPFLLAVDPELAIISAGRDNRFGHPHKEVTDRFESLGIAVRGTAKEGTISLEY